MFVVGLTGGIGSGKSTVAALFKSKGVPVIDADELARKVIQPDQPAFEELTQLFGTDILLPTGELDRAKLKKIVFLNEAKRKQLEQLLHPLIRAEMKKQIEALDAPYCIAMIPLLLETTPNPLINRVLVVDTTEELQISRAMARDKLSREDVEAILKTQVNRSQRLALADDIITNDSTHEALISQANQLHDFYLSLSA